MMRLAFSLLALVALALPAHAHGHRVQAVVVQQVYAAPVVQIVQPVVAVQAFVQPVYAAPVVQQFAVQQFPQPVVQQFAVRQKLNLRHHRHQSQPCVISNDESNCLLQCNFIRDSSQLRDGGCEAHAFDFGIGVET